MWHLRQPGGILPSESGLTVKGCFLSIVSGINHDPNVGSALWGECGVALLNCSKSGWKAHSESGTCTSARAQMPRENPCPSSRVSEAWKWEPNPQTPSGEVERTYKTRVRKISFEAWLWLFTIGIFWANQKIALGLNVFHLYNGDNNFYPSCLKRSLWIQWTDTFPAFLLEGNFCPSPHVFASLHSSVSSSFKVRSRCWFVNVGHWLKHVILVAPNIIIHMWSSLFVGSCLGYDFPPREGRYLWPHLKLRHVYLLRSSYKGIDSSSKPHSHTPLYMEPWIMK